MKKDRLSSLVASSSMLILTVMLFLTPSFASAASGSANYSVSKAVSGATCSGNVVTASINGGTVTFENKFQRDIEVGVASYKAFDSNIDTQQLFDSKVGTVPACGTLTLSIGVPSCNYQLDAFLGGVLQSMNGQRYGSRLLTAKDTGTTNFCSQVADESKSPSATGNGENTAVQDVGQIPAGLPQTGFGNFTLTSDNNTGSSNGGLPGGLLVALVSLACILGGVVFYRRATKKA